MALNNRSIFTLADRTKAGISAKPGETAASHRPEELLLLIAPLFLLFSLRDFLPLFSLCPVVVVSLAVLFYFRRKLLPGQSFREFFLTRYLPLFALLIFIAATWNIYHVHTLNRFPDSIAYVRISNSSLSEIDFWLFGSKTFVTPLIFKVFQRDWAALNVFYILIYLVSALIFGFVLTRFFSRTHVRVFAVYLFIFFFLNQQSMGLWMVTALSEMPTIAVTLTMLAICGFSFLYQRRPSPKHHITCLLIAAHILIAPVFSFARDSNFYFLPILLLFQLHVFKKFRQRAVLVFFMLAIFALSAYSLKYSGRWKLPLANTIMRAIIPNQDLRQLFQKKYNLPPDELIMPFAGKFAYEDAPNKEIIVDLQHRQSRPGTPLPEDWVSRHGMSAYASYLINHAGDVIQGWIEDWDVYNSDLWRYASRNKRMRNKKLNQFLFSFPGHVSFFMAILILLFAIRHFKENPLILLCLAHAFVIGFISLIGDVAERGRHCQQASMTLKIAFLLFVLHAYGKISRANGDGA